MEFRELIRTRESIRNYDPDRPVGKKTLIRILEAGRLAPSAANKQPWRFIIISSKERLPKVKLCYEKTWFQEAPHILAVVGNKKSAWVRSHDNRCFIETDLAIAMDHLILAAENEGVSTCWISNFKPDVLHNALGLQDHECVYAITPLGYPKMDFSKKGSKERKALEEIVSWE
jgi:nitroreductase